MHMHRLTLPILCNFYHLSHFLVRCSFFKILPVVVQVTKSDSNDFVITTNQTFNNDLIGVISASLFGEILVSSGTTTLSYSSLTLVSNFQFSNNNIHDHTGLWHATSTEVLNSVWLIVNILWVFSWTVIQSLHTELESVLAVIFYMFFSNELTSQSRSCHTCITNSNQTFTVLPDCWNCESGRCGWFGQWTPSYTGCSSFASNYLKLGAYYIGSCLRNNSWSDHLSLTLSILAILNDFSAYSLSRFLPYYISSSL